MNSGIFERQHFRQRDRSVTLPFASAQGRLAQGDDCLDYLSIDEKVECVGFVFMLRGMGPVPVLPSQFLLFFEAFWCRLFLCFGRWCQIFFASVL
jgi:hypothetical protein